jgi:hypothetical protein
MKLTAFFGVASPLRTVPLLQAACLGAAVLCALTAGGCDQPGIGMNEPGIYDKVELGQALPADVWPPAEAPRLGASSCLSQHRGFEGESARELVRAAVDAGGNVVASHCLRTWRHKPLLGPGEDIMRFTLDLRVPGMPDSPVTAPASAPASGPVRKSAPGDTPGAPAAGKPAAAGKTPASAPASAPVRDLAPGDSPGAVAALAGPAPTRSESVFVSVTTVPLATGQATTRTARQSVSASPAATKPASAPARAEPLSAGTLVGAFCLDAPLDEDLLTVAREQALSKGPRPAPPGNWQEFGAAVLAKLNQQRQGDLQPAVDSPVASVADMILLAEMMLQSIPMEGETWMDRIVWKKLDLPDALRKVPTALPDRPGQAATWSHTEITDAAGVAVTMDLPYALHGAATHTRYSTTLTNLGQGHVRVTLQAERLTGQPQD